MGVGEEEGLEPGRSSGGGGGEVAGRRCGCGEGATVDGRAGQRGDEPDEAEEELAGGEGGGWHWEAGCLMGSGRGEYAEKWNGDRGWITA